jgi:CHAT domain-containing protein
MLAAGVSTPGTYRLPNGGQLPLLPLPGARAEAEYAARLFPGSTALLDGDAQVEHIRDLAPRHKLIHLAAHCEVVPASPLETTIVLADGGLPMHSFVAMALDAELVTLSACSSAIGPVTQGDDVLNFTRALLIAGAHAAVVTLWKVQDVSTSLLMSKFYIRLREGAAPPVALQEAQTWLRSLRRQEAVSAMDDLGLPRASVPSRGFDHPYHWAAFQFVGRPLPLSAA